MPLIDFLIEFGFQTVRWRFESSFTGVSSAAWYSSFPTRRTLHLAIQFTKVTSKLPEIGVSLGVASSRPYASSGKEPAGIRG
jgi:hypothetical protein